MNTIKMTTAPTTDNDSASSPASPNNPLASPPLVAQKTDILDDEENG